MDINPFSFVTQAIQEQMKLHGHEPVKFEDIKVTVIKCISELFSSRMHERSCQLGCIQWHALCSCRTKSLTW